MTVNQFGRNVFRLFTLGLLIAILAMPAVQTDAEAPDAPEEQNYPLVQRHGFTVQRFGVAAPRSQTVTLPYPTGADDVIPICAIASYQTYGTDTLGWTCGWNKSGRNVSFTLSTTRDSNGYIEATAVLLSKEYFSVINGDIFDEGPAYWTTEFDVYNRDTEVSFRSSDNALPIVSVYRYDSGDDKDFQFLIRENLYDLTSRSRLDGAEHTGSTEIIYRGMDGNGASQVSGAIIAVVAQNGARWQARNHALYNGFTVNLPESGMSINTDDYDVLAFPSLISMVTGTDDDFEFTCNESWYTDQVRFHSSTYNGNDDSWAEWQFIVIQTPKS